MSCHGFFSEIISIDRIGKVYWKAFESYFFGIAVLFVPLHFCVFVILKIIPFVPFKHIKNFCFWHSIVCVWNGVNLLECHFIWKYECKLWTGQLFEHLTLQFLDFWFFVCAVFSPFLLYYVYVRHLFQIQTNRMFVCALIAM